MTPRQTPDVREVVARIIIGPREDRHAGAVGRPSLDQLQDIRWKWASEQERKEALWTADCILASLDSRAGDAGEPVAWCSPGQLANLTDVDRDAGVYLPIRKTKRGNFTMPLFATPAPAVDAQEAGRPCDTCQGNGEVVTDWERYMHGKPGDMGDEGTKECPDCDGTGRVEDAPAVDAGKDHNGGYCPDCDGTGDVHRIDGEWLGSCHCAAGTFSNPSTFGKPTFGVEVAPAVDAVPAGEVDWTAKAAERMVSIAAIPDAMIDAALNARVPGGAPVLAWLPMEDAWTPSETARDIIRHALFAALSHGEGR